jgi:tRNA threonylcarbamoyladenosine biosynthesis protein TsaE
LGRHLSTGAVVALYGELGSGKTCLTQGIAKGLEVPQGFYITSPTFALINEYPGRIPLFHMDFYRMTDMSEFDEIGIDEILSSDGIAVIEWADKFPSALPKERLDLSLTILDDQKRALVLTGYGRQAVALAKMCAGFGNRLMP